MLYEEEMENAMIHREARGSVTSLMRNEIGLSAIHVMGGEFVSHFYRDYGFY